MSDTNPKITSLIPPSADRMGALLNAAVDGIVLIDTAGHIAGFNAAAGRMFGYTEDQVLGRNVKLLMPNPYQDEHNQYLQRYLTTKQPRIIGIGREVMARRSDGSTFPIELSVGEFKTGTEHGFVGMIRDITQRKRQEDALRESTEELQLIFDSAPAAIAITEIHSGLISANRAFERLFGYATEELAGRKYRDLAQQLVVEDEREDVLAEVINLYRTGEGFSRDVRFRARDGRQIPTTLYAGSIRAKGNRNWLMISQIIDNSRRYAAEHEAEELRSLLAHVGRLGTLGEMVSGIAHEVNQPLTAIANYANAIKRMLRSGQTTTEEVANALEKISAQAERAGQVIHGLRKLTRRREAERIEIDCNGLIREVSRLVELELRFSDRELVLELDPRNPKIYGDNVQFQQVMLNLIRNALEAMKDAAIGDAVIVRTSVLADGWVEIVVADSGPGLTPEIEDRLFEPFFTTKTRGMGLGLSICRSIVSALGGHLTYRPASTVGAEFVIRLPLATPESTTTP